MTCELSLQGLCLLGQLSVNAETADREIPSVRREINGELVNGGS